MPGRRITRTTIDRVPRLSAGQRDEMFELLTRYYDGVTREQFEADLDAKQRVIRMLDAEGGTAGFSTIQVLPVEYQGRRSLAVFSGDTVIDHECWGQKQLQKAFTRFLIRCWLRNPFGGVYWFLISKGFKTYLLMRNNFASWPNHRQATPPEVQAVLHEVAQRKYPDHYDPARGVISFPGVVASAVKGEFLALTDEELRNPEIRFFLEKNPGYEQGDELCCLAKVRLRELIWIALKYGVWHPLRGALGLKKRRPRPQPAPASPPPATAGHTTPGRPPD